VNLPHEATVEDIEDAYMQAWRLGLKAIAVYRDGCKRVQPLVLSRTSATVEETHEEGYGPPEAVRHRLPDERQSLTHKFSVGGHEGYLTVGMYTDGRPGEIFICMAKEGSTISGLMDSFAPPSRSPCSTGADQAALRTSSPTPASSPRASRSTPRSATPSRSWTTSSAGWS